MIRENVLGPFSAMLHQSVFMMSKFICAYVLGRNVRKMTKIR